MNLRHGFIAAWLLTVGIITYEDIKNCQALPWPPRIMAAALVFGLLDIFSLVSEELAGTIAIGIILAAIVNKGFNPSCEHSQGTAQPASYNSLQGGFNTQPDGGGWAQ